MFLFCKGHGINMTEFKGMEFLPQSIIRAIESVAGKGYEGVKVKNTIIIIDPAGMYLEGLTDLGDKMFYQRWERIGGGRVKLGAIKKENLKSVRESFSKGKKIKTIGEEPTKAARPPEPPKPKMEPKRPDGHALLERIKKMKKRPR